MAIGRVRLMPFGRARAETAARQVRLIEAEGPDEARAYALETLVESLTWIGEPGEALRPFVKLLRWWDAHPEFFDEGDQNILFWEFGWIVSDMCRSADQPVERVERTLDDMERRFALANRGLERVWACRLDWEMLRAGPALPAVFSAWLTMPVDAEDSCLACHENHHAEYLVATGDLAGAAAVAEAALTADVACSREPMALMALAIWCHLELGHLDEVGRLLPQALAEGRTVLPSSVIVPLGRLFEVLARTGNAARALKLLPGIATSLPVATQYVHLECWRHLLAGLTVLTDNGYAAEPVAVPGFDATTVDGLTELVGRQAEALTEAFDTRHGTTVQAERLARARAASFVPYPLDAPVPPPVPAAPAVAPAVVPEPRTTTRDRAEAAFEGGDHPRAAALYRRAAAEAQAAGSLAEAGWCWAEAARNAQEIGQLVTAGHDYIEAATRLRAAGVTLEEIAPMYIAWAPGVQAGAYRTYVRLALDDYPTPAHTGVTEKIEELAPALFEATMLSAPLFRRYVLARAGLRDAVARVMATWGDATDHQRALELAEESASRFLALGRTEAAAHAWWLAGRLAARLQAKSTDTNFAMALQGFRSTGERNRRYGVSVATDYARYLTEAGRTYEAGSVLGAWTGRDR